ncbi:MAG: hypothetical protein NTY17_15310 [Planctomycetia bacterium]|nr:hypothetical protein [Planctomycetia bacterium]
MLIPSTAAPIASQNTAWNAQKIRLRHLGSDRRRKRRDPRHVRSLHAVV